MNKATWTLTLLGLSSFGLRALPAPGGQQAVAGWQPGASASYLFKEEAITLEYTVGEDETTIIVVTESEEPIDRLEVVSPGGAPMMRMQGEKNRGMTMQGFEFETVELDLDTLPAYFPEGTYQLRGRTDEGQVVMGSAVLSHELPRVARVAYPYEDATDVPVSGLVVTWAPDSDLDGFKVVLEQENRDGLTIFLPADCGSLVVPDGLLEPGVETFLEIGSIGANGNVTYIEIPFTTEPQKGL